jgi:hypothetical protein
MLAAIAAPSVLLSIGLASFFSYAESHPPKGGQGSPTD